MVGFHLLTAFSGDDQLERAANPCTEALNQGLGDSFCTEHYTTQLAISLLQSYALIARENIQVPMTQRVPQMPRSQLQHPAQTNSCRRFHCWSQKGTCPAQKP